MLSSHKGFITYVRGHVGLDSVVRNMLQNCSFKLYFLFIVLKHGLYGCTVRYNTSLPGHVYLQEKQNVLQEKEVGSTKRKGIYLATFSEQAKEKYPLALPSGQKCLKAKKLDPMAPS